MRGVDEPVEDYLLRPTRLLPRDIIMLGNLLCDGVSRAREQGETSLTDATVRELVHKAGRWFGDQQIAVCANHIASDTMTPEASKHGFSEVFTGEAGYRRGGDGLDCHTAARPYWVPMEQVRWTADGRPRWDAPIGGGGGVERRGRPRA